MIAYDGQSILDLYINALLGQPSISKNDINYLVKNSTSISYVEFSTDGFQFRFDTKITLRGTISQYVTVTATGEMIFRNDWQWFIPGDICFNTFSDALKYLADINK